MSREFVQSVSFDLKLAMECATAYSNSTGLGCTVSDTDGTIFYEAGYGCRSCALCEITGMDSARCMRAHDYGMTEAERFGGKYIYFCPMGVTCFVSPIIGQLGSEAKITVGPFLMVEREDYEAFELQQSLCLDEHTIVKVMDALTRLPYVVPDKVHALSNLLFMTVGFLNNVSASSRMLEIQDADAIQEQVSEYILKLKGGESPGKYPVETERAMLSSIAASDQTKAQKHLNELLGYILFSSGGNLSQIKTRLFELLVLISRVASDAGVSADQAFRINHRFYRQAQKVSDIDQLCHLITNTMNRYIDSLFDFVDVKYVDVLHKAVQYMCKHYSRKLSLEHVAQEVYLSPSYFGKIFKQEMGYSFSAYLNRLRIEQSKRFLAHQNMKLVDIALLVGFEDQSYFTKVFKRIVGVSPNQYRQSGGRLRSS